MPVSLKINKTKKYFSFFLVCFFWFSIAFFCVLLGFSFASCWFICLFAFLLLRKENTKKVLSFFFASYLALFGCLTLAFEKTQKDFLGLFLVCFPSRKTKTTKIFLLVFLWSLLRFCKKFLFKKRPKRFLFVRFYGFYFCFLLDFLWFFFIFFSSLFHCVLLLLMLFLSSSYLSWMISVIKLKTIKRFPFCVLLSLMHFKKRKQQKDLCLAFICSILELMKRSKISLLSSLFCVQLSIDFSFSPRRHLHDIIITHTI